MLFKELCVVLSVINIVCGHPQLANVDVDLLPTRTSTIPLPTLTKPPILTEGADVDKIYPTRTVLPTPLPGPMVTKTPGRNATYDKYMSPIPSEHLATSLDQIGKGFDTLVQRINSGDVSIYDSTEELKKMNVAMKKIQQMIKDILIEVKHNKMETMVDLHMMEYRIRRLTNKIEYPQMVHMNKSSNNGDKPTGNKIPQEKDLSSLVNKQLIASPANEGMREITKDLPKGQTKDVVCMMFGNKTNDVQKPFYVKSLNKCFATSNAKHTVEEANNLCFNRFNGCIYQPPNERSLLPQLNIIRSEGNISSQDIFYVGIKRSAEFAMIGTKNANIEYPMMFFDDKLLHTFSYVGRIYGVIRFDASIPKFGFHRNETSKVKVICEFYPANTVGVSPWKLQQDGIPNLREIDDDNANIAKTITSSAKINNNNNNSKSITTTMDRKEDDVTPAYRAMNIYLNTRKRVD